MINDFIRSSLTGEKEICSCDFNRLVLYSMQKKHIKYYVKIDILDYPRFPSNGMGRNYHALVTEDGKLKDHCRTPKCENVIRHGKCENF